MADPGTLSPAQRQLALRRGLMTEYASDSPIGYLARQQKVYSMIKLGTAERQYRVQARYVAQPPDRRTVTGYVDAQLASPPPQVFRNPYVAVCTASPAPPPPPG